MLYEVAVLELPTKKDEEERNALPRLVIAPTAVVARDDRDAAIKVALEAQEIRDADKDRLQVLVRPFGGTA